MSDVEIYEKGPREGFQFEKGPIATRGKIELIAALARTGLRRIQTVAFVNPKRVPGWADAEEVVAGLPDVEGVQYTATCLNARGVERAVATGRIFLDGSLSSCSSEVFLMRNQNQDFARNLEDLDAKAKLFKAHGATEFHAGVMASFGCNFKGEVTVDETLAGFERVMQVARDNGIRITHNVLTDTMAWATPNAIKRFVGALQDRWPEVPISLHLHDTRGLAMANALAGLEMGVRHFDSSIGGLGGCPFGGHKGAAGNICTEDLAFMCEEMGLSTGLDLEALIEAARVAERVVGHDLPGGIMHGGLLRAAA